MCRAGFRAGLEPLSPKGTDYQESGTLIIIGWAEGRGHPRAIGFKIELL